MEQFYLPHPKGGLRVEMTLELVAKLEESGSLLGLAEKLVARQLKLAEAVALLKIVYSHAGSVPTDDFIVAQQPHLQLARLLTAIIAPLAALGAIDASKKA